MKKLIIALLALVVGLTSLTACAQPEPEYAAVCVDPNTEERLPDSACGEAAGYDDSGSDFLTYAVLWYMLMDSSRPYPAVGSKVNKSYFTTKLPDGKRYTTGLSSKGGSSVKSWSTTSRKSGTTFGTGGSKSTTKSGTGSTKSGGGFSSGTSRSTGRR